MSDLEPILRAFRNSLQKEAASFGQAVTRHGNLLKNIGSLAGVGSTLGALGGAGFGASQGYREAREEGHGVGTSALNALAQGAGGAAKGGLVGAAAGGLAGGLGSKVLNPSSLTQRGGVLGAGARFGQRQVHSLTGVLTPAELEGVRGGAYGARRAVVDAEQKLKDAPWLKDSKLTPSKMMEMGDKAELSKSRAVKGLQSAENVQNMGLTSIPGYIDAIKNHGAGKVLGAGLRDQVRNMHPGMAAVALGMPAMGVLRAATAKKNERGAGRGESVGYNLGNAIGGVAGAAMPVVGSAVLGETLGSAGGLVGRGVDRLRGRKKENAPLSMVGPPQLEPAESQNTPTERVMSPNAAGQKPDLGSFG